MKNLGIINGEINRLEAKIAEQSKDLMECKRVRDDQRQVVEGMFQQNEVLRMHNMNAEQSARIFYTQCQKAQSELGSLVAVLNSEFDMAYLLWSTTPSKPLEARLDVLGNILKSLGLFDKFNKPRWQDIQSDVDGRG